MFNLDILVVGVGGQGSVLASDIICATALEENFDVKNLKSMEWHKEVAV